MANSGSHRAKSIASQRENPFANLERRRDQEGSMHTTHTSKSHSRVGNHVSQEQHNKAMQREIDQLKKKLRHVQRKQTPIPSDSSSDDEKDSGYRCRSRIPPSESFSYKEEHHSERRCRSPIHRGLENDAMSKALNQIAKSPFTNRIERVAPPRHFHQPTFTIYNGQTDPVEHMSHFNQRMAVYSKDETLMCKVFPSSLELVAIRWFNGLRTGSINSFKELTRAFGFRFITCTRVPQPLDSLLSLSMREEETLKTYSNRYWEMYNEIEGNFKDITISTFKSVLPIEHGLRKSLTGKPVTSLRQLMDQIDKYKRIEEDQQLGKGKAKVIPQEMRDFRSDRFNNNQPRKDFVGQSGSTNTQTVNAIFREPVHQVLEKIKNESFFK